MKIGFIGLGIMGESMCENIVKKHDDTVYCFDFVKEKVENTIKFFRKRKFCCPLTHNQRKRARRLMVFRKSLVPATKVKARVIRKKEKKH